MSGILDLCSESNKINFINMIKIIFLSLILLANSFAVAQEGLKGKIEADRQMLVATDAIKSEEWRAAVTAFAAAELASPTQLPEIFNYIYGKAYNELGDYEAAAQRLGLYLKKYGDKGRYYTLTLEQLNRSERGSANEKKKREEAERIERKWQKRYFLYSTRLGADDSYCDSARARLFEVVKRTATRNRTCTCKVEFLRFYKRPGTHSCMGEFEFNNELDKDEDVDGYINNIGRSSRLIIQDKPFEE